MRPELKRLHSPDVEKLENFAPQEEDNFGFLLQMMVGPSDSAEEESFDIQICTPKWLEQRYRSVGIISLRHHVLVFSYDYSSLVATLKNLLASCWGASWEEVAMKVGRIGQWEFEDYQADLK